MARQQKEGATKRTYRLSDDMIARLTRIALVEGRTVTAQLERFVWEKIREYEKQESTPGQPRAARLAA